MAAFEHAFLKNKLLSFLVMLVGTVLVCSISVYVYSSQSDEQRNVAVHFLYVDQGDSIYIRAPNGNTLLLDAGQDNHMAREEIGKIKNIFDRSIDVVLGSHPDADHVGGIERMFMSYDTSLYVDPGYMSETDIYKNLLQAVQKKNIQYQKLRSGMRIVIDRKEDVYLEILAPHELYVLSLYEECVKQNTKKKRKKKCENVFDVDTNDMSVVSKLVYKDTSFFLTGDASQSVELFLLENLQEHMTEVDVLKLGHHGSKTSTHASFVGALNPKYAVVSAGEKNRYGHPHKIVLDTVERASQAKVIRLDTTTESVEFVSDGSTVWIKK